MDYDSHDVGNTLIKKMDMFMTQDKAARILARRSRVRRQSQDLKGEEIVIDEDFSQIEQNSLREVQMAAFVAGFETDSDDEEPKLSEKAAELWSFQWEQEQSLIDY